MVERWGVVDGLCSGLGNVSRRGGLESAAEVSHDQSRIARSGPGRIRGHCPCRVLRGGFARASRDGHLLSTQSGLRADVGSRASGGIRRALRVRQPCRGRRRAAPGLGGPNSTRSPEASEAAGLLRLEPGRRSHLERAAVAVSAVLLRRGAVVSGIGRGGLRGLSARGKGAETAVRKPTNRPCGEHRRGRVLDSPKGNIASYGEWPADRLGRIAAWSRSAFASGVERPRPARSWSSPSSLRGPRRDLVEAAVLGSERPRDRLFAYRRLGDFRRGRPHGLAKASGRTVFG